MSDRRVRGLLSSIAARNAVGIRQAQRRRALLIASGARQSLVGARPILGGKPIENITGIVTLNPVTIPSDTLVTFPPGNNAVPIPVAPTYSTLKVTINLALADKLAGTYSVDSGGKQIVINGKSLIFTVYLSTDGNNTGGERRFELSWQSYGPSGSSGTDPWGDPFSNLDPSIIVPLAVFAGQGAYLTLITHGITSAGATIDGRGLS